MSSLRPYLFDRPFETRREIHAAERGSLPPTSETRRPITTRSYTQTDLDRARREGMAEGEALAQAAAQAANQNRLALALEQLGAELKALQGCFDGVQGRAISDAVTVAVAIARKIAPALYAQSALADVERMVATVLRQLGAAPKLLIRVSPALTESLTHKLAEIKDDAGFTGAVTVTPDPALAAGDCLVDWQAGEAVRRLDDLWSEIDAVLARMAGPNHVGGPPTPDHEDAIDDATTLPRPMVRALSSAEMTKGDLSNG